jgi:hypothetical protein
VLFPFLTFLFPSLKSNKTSGSKQNGDDNLKKPEQRNVHDHPRTADEFLRKHLSLTTKKTNRDYDINIQQYKPLIKSNQVVDLQLQSQSPKVATTEHEQIQIQKLRQQLQLKPSSVITIAIRSDYIQSTTATNVDTDLHSSKDDLIALLKVLAPLAQVFLLVKLASSSSSSSSSSSLSSSPQKEGDNKASMVRARIERERIENALNEIIDNGEGTGKATGADKATDTNTNTDTNTSPCMLRHRILYSESTIGRTAAIRQLKPTIHVDFDHDVCRNMEQHVRTIIYANIYDSNSNSNSNGNGSRNSKCSTDDSKRTTNDNDNDNNIDIGRVRTLSGHGLVQIHSLLQLTSLEILQDK